MGEKRGPRTRSRGKGCVRAHAQAHSHASDARTPILFFFLQRLRALAATQSQS